MRLPSVEIIGAGLALVACAGATDARPQVGPASPCAGGFTLDGSNGCAAWHTPAPDWPRFETHTATLLDDGRVLVVGRVLGEVEANSALFDPADDTWTLLADGPVARVGRTATRVADGRVLVLGGTDGSETASAEATWFDPATQGWSGVAPMETGRAYHSAVRLRDGRVLVAGGQAGDGDDPLSSVEVFDTWTWHGASPMTEPRQRHTATVVDGLVVVVGGVGQAGALGGTELYFPDQDTWAELGDVGGPAVAHTTTALADSSLVVVSNGTGAMTMTWHSHWYATAAMHWPRSNHVAVLLRDGRLLVAGGTPYQPLLTPEVYDPDADVWTAGADHPIEIWDGSATLLDDDRVLVISSQALLYETAPPL